MLTQHFLIHCLICPIGYDDDFHAYNINADDAACAIARAVSAEKLAFLTDIEGVYKDFDDKDSLISELSTSEARTLLESGTIGGGMLPKLNNCIDAIEHGVFLMEEFHTAFFLKYLLTRVLVQLFFQMMQKNSLIQINNCEP
mgnify:CR=1 FL=1